jgi:hypothetical protein
MTYEMLKPGSLEWEAVSARRLLSFCLYDREEYAKALARMESSEDLAPIEVEINGFRFRSVEHV